MIILCEPSPGLKPRVFRTSKIKNGRFEDARRANLPQSGRGEVDISYKTAKSFHLAGLVAWLGPSTGGYILILLSRFQGQNQIELWLFKEYIHLIDLEAAGLLTLIATGIAMLRYNPGLRSAGWLKRKLLIVFFVFVPLQAIQLYIFHFIVRRAFLTGAGVDAAISIYDKFSAISFIILLVAVPIVFRLAVFRPGPKNAATNDGGSSR